MTKYNDDLYDQVLTRARAVIEVANNTMFPDAGLAGIKYDSGKPRMDLLSSSALFAISDALAFGANKYGDNDWRKGMAWSRYYAAAMRHLLAHMDGEDKDSESGLSHLAHLGCCVMFLLEYEKKGLGRDDRFKGVTNAKV